MSDSFPYDPAALDEDDAGAEKSLRPGSLDEFIGQRGVVENLRIAIEAARARGEVLDHVLLCGMPGLGKTTLATLLASAMGTDFHSTTGPAIDNPTQVIGLLSGLKRGDVLFIDEIHRLSSETEEYLYSAMEDYKIDLLLGSGPDARSLQLKMEPFTLVGATTREGMLSAPFRSRFGIVERLESYPPADILVILERSAAILGCELAGAAGDLLAERCRGTPRCANRFLRRIRDLAQCQLEPRQLEPAGARRPAGRGRVPITPEVVEQGLTRLGIDANGLDRVDRKILEVLVSAGEPVGVKTIAVSVGEEERTIEDVHEPYLIQRGLLLKTPRGRRASPAAHDLYPAAGTLRF